MARLPLETRRAMLSVVPTAIVKGGNGSLALAGGTPTSNTQNIAAPLSGIQLYAWLRVSGKINNAHTSNAATRTPMGAANLIEYLRYTDPYGFDRHQISGIGLELINSERQGTPMGAAQTLSNNYGVTYDEGTDNYMPATIAAGATVDFSHVFNIPFAVTNGQFDGAVVATNSGGAQNFAVTFAAKDRAFVASGASPVFAVYQGGTCTYTELKYELYIATKNFNLPFGNLPDEDFENVYILNQSSYGGIAGGADNKYRYDHGKTYLGRWLMFDNNGTLNTGSDVSSLSLLLQGSQDMDRLSPDMHRHRSKMYLGCGLPKGCYHRSHREWPLNIANTGGSADFIFQPLASTLNDGAQVYIYDHYIQAGKTASV